MEESFFSFLKEFFEATADYNEKIGKLCEEQAKRMNSTPKVVKPKQKPAFRKTMGY
jgi:hypothetical protein